MTNKKTVISLVVIVVILVVIIAVLGWNRGSNKGITTTAVGGLLAENYDPYLRSNGGFFTALPIKTTDDLQTTGTFTMSGTASLTGPVSIGSTGTSLTQLNKGTCILYQYVNTIAATSSITTDCVNTTSSGFGTSGGLVALTGVQRGDQVFATLSTSTSAVVSTAGGLVLTGASASSTNGYITVTLTNLKGTTFTFPTGASSTVSYLTVR